MRQQLRVAIACCAVALSAAPADPWVRIRSPHFELFTTAGESGGRDLIGYLEQVRAFFQTAFDLTGPVSQPIRVIAFRTEKEYRPYRPNDVADAFFRSGADHSFIVMQNAAGDLYSTAVHEYTHLLLRQTRMDVPLWLSEGLAELYSTLQAAGPKILVGGPIPNRIQALEREPWIDLRTLVSPAPISNRRPRAAMFYAESWALVHMLSLDDRYASRLRALLSALQSGDAPAAFEKTFGRSIEHVDRDLRAYAQGDFSHVAVFELQLANPAKPAAAGGSEGDVAPRIETNAGLYARLALAELLSSDSAASGRATAAYQSLSREFQNRWEVEAGWGAFCARERRNPEAIQHFALADSLGCEDARMYLAWAQVLNASGHYADAIPPLHAGLRLDPALNEARLELAVDLVRAGQDREGIAEFHRIRNLGAEHAYRYFYFLALAHSRLGDTAQARRLINRARAETRNREEIESLGRLLQSLEQ